MTDYVALQVTIEHHIASIVLRGPGKGNALGPDFWREMPLAIEALELDDNVRVIVLSGAEGNFTYGLDLMGMRDELRYAMEGNNLAAERTKFLDRLELLQGATTAILNCRKPVIACVSGWCVGAGIDRARALAGLAPYLGASERAAAVEDALQECVRTRDPFQRRIVVGGLAPWLDRRQHDTVLDVVAGGNPHDVRLLCCCGPHLDATQLDRALDLLGDRRLDHIAGGEELLALRAYLSPAQRARAARDLVARTVRTRGGLDHPSAVALAALADDLTDAQVDAVVETAALPYESHHRAWLIAAVLPRLSVARAARALEHALGIPDPAWRIPVLGGLFPRLDDGGRSRVVAAASAVDEPALRVAAIAAYAVHLPPSAQEPHVAAALDVAEAIAEPSHRAIVLTGLAAAVASDGPLRLAFAAAQVVDDRSRRIRALAAVGGVITGTRPDPPAIPPVFPAGTST